MITPPPASAFPRPNAAPFLQYLPNKVVNGAGAQIEQVSILSQQDVAWFTISALLNLFRVSPGYAVPVNSQDALHAQDYGYEHSSNLHQVQLYFKKTSDHLLLRGIRWLLPGSSTVLQLDAEKSLRSPLGQELLRYLFPLWNDAMVAGAATYQEPPPVPVENGAQPAPARPHGSWTWIELIKQPDPSGPSQPSIPWNADYVTRIVLNFDPVPSDAPTFNLDQGV